jgi:ATP-binding cassette subfamily B protein
LQNSLAAMDRILDLYEEPTEQDEHQGGKIVTCHSALGEIIFDDVSFSYPGSDAAVLHNISFVAPAGKTIALVGPSGSGKTTLCNLVAAFYKASQGFITLDGSPLQDIDLHAYRTLLGIVEQDIFLFEGTIASNIAYGKRGATSEQIQTAAQQAAAHEFISEFSAGYETEIGERGVKLSGGQRQRIAIARALLADPRILILDEATSNLDTESERLIQHSLSTLLKNRTSFVIAHRLSTIRDADLILVLDKGRIIESGTHEALMERSERYHDMVILQTQPQN